MTLWRAQHRTALEGDGQSSEFSFLGHGVSSQGCIPSIRFHYLLICFAAFSLHSLSGASLCSTFVLKCDFNEKQRPAVEPPWPLCSVLGAELGESQMWTEPLISKSLQGVTDQGQLQLRICACLSWLLLLNQAAPFTIARTWKPPKCPSAEDWIKKIYDGNIAQS